MPRHFITENFRIGAGLRQKMPVKSGPAEHSTEHMGICSQLNLIYSEKVKNIFLNLRIVTSKNIEKLFWIFMAFLEYLNFTFGRYIYPTPIKDIRLHPPGKLVPTQFENILSGLWKVYILRHFVLNLHNNHVR